MSSLSHQFINQIKSKSSSHEITFVISLLFDAGIKAIIRPSRVHAALIFEQSLVFFKSLALSLVRSSSIDFLDPASSLLCFKISVRLRYDTNLAMIWRDLRFLCVSRWPWI